LNKIITNNNPIQILNTHLQQKWSTQTDDQMAFTFESTKFQWQDTKHKN